VQDDGTRADSAHELARSGGLPLDADVEARADDGAAEQVSFARQARAVLVSRWDILSVIAAGGALGSLGRWSLGEALARPGSGFPWATFVENLSGGFALGLLMVLVLDVWPPSRYVRPFFGVGVLGGYTTFSTYLLDTRELVAADRLPVAVVYLFGTLAAGLVAVWSGILLARLLADPGTRRSRRRRKQAELDATSRRQS
jgi:CrcB protein